MYGEEKYILLNNGITVTNEYGEVEYFDMEEAKQEIENGNFMEVAKIIEPEELDRE